MKQQWANVLLIIVSLFGLVAGASAATHPEITVKIPHEFVVGGRTLPAGTYTVSRLADDRRSALSIASYEQGSTVVVLAKEFENHSVDDSKILFERVGDAYYLSSIQMVDGVYTFSLPHSALLMAKSANTGDVSASGTH